MALLAIVPPLAGAVYTAVQWRHHETLEMESFAVHVARHAAAIHERDVAAVRNLLFALAQVPSVRTGDPAALADILGTFLHVHPTHENVGVLTGDGRLLASARPADFTDASAHAFYQRAVATGRFASGEYGIDAAAGKTSVTFAYPLLDRHGVAERVVFASVWLTCLDELAVQARFPRGTTVTILDDGGRVLAHEPASSAWLGRSGRGEPVFQAMALAHAPEGTTHGTLLDTSTRRVFGFKRLVEAAPEGSGYVAVGVPMAAVTADPDRVLAHNLGGLLIATIIGLVVAWVGSDVLFVRRVKSLIAATKRISGGDLTARTGLVRGPAELRDLAGAFDEMAAALQGHEREVVRQHAALATQESRFRALIEHSSDGLALLDESGTVTYASASTTRLSGYASEELIGRSVFEFIHPADRGDVRGRLDELLREPGALARFSCRIVHKDGARRWIDYIASNLLAEPSVRAIVVNYRDVTERKEAERALQQAHDELQSRVVERSAQLVEVSEAFRGETAGRRQVQEALNRSRAMLADLLDSAINAIITVDAEYRIILYNAAAERTFRCPRAAAIGAPIKRFIPDALHELLTDALRSLPVRDTEALHARQRRALGVRADGEVFPIEAAVSRSHAEGEPVYTIILQDITERERAEEALRKLSRAIEQTGDSVVITDRDGTIEYVNPSFEKQTGFSATEAIGATPRILKSGQHPAAFYERLWTTILGGGVFRSVFTNKRKDGALYHEDQTITPVRDALGTITHFISTGRDITQRKRTEQALRRLNAQLEHEATRIAGVLHDEAGQFLTTAHITLAEVAHDLPSAERTRLVTVRRDLDRIEEQLRRLSHELHPRILDDLGFVDALRFLAAGVAGRTGIPVLVEASLTKRCPPEVETALYRLVQEGLTNMTKHARATRATVVVRQDGCAVHCTVSDDGTGFDVAATLGGRQPSGLGLAGIRDRLEAVGGVLEIVSAPGAGTELRVTVPLETAG